MQGVIRVTSSQIGKAPKHSSKREKYLKKYKDRDKELGIQKTVRKRGIQELEPRPNLPRRRPPHYLTISESEMETAMKSYEERQKSVIFERDVTTFTNIVVGDPYAVMMQRNCRTPILPLSRGSSSHRPRQHSRCRTAQESTRNYNQGKSLSWKYYGEVDQQMGCLTEHIRVKRPEPIYAKTLNFSTAAKTSILYNTALPLHTSTPRL